MHYVYLLKNQEDNRLYVWQTTDLKRRFQEHISWKSDFTKLHCHAWELIYYEAYSNKTDAIVRERRLKAHGSWMVELKKRISQSLED